MPPKLEQLFQIYRLLFIIHVGTKTTDGVFHEKSAPWYELMFQIVHEISEKRQDLDLTNPIPLEAAVKKADESFQDAFSVLDELIAEKNSPGMDNTLRNLYDKLEFEYGNLKAFIK